MRLSSLSDMVGALEGGAASGAVLEGGCGGPACGGPPMPGRPETLHTAMLDTTMCCKASLAPKAHACQCGRRTEQHLGQTSKQGHDSSLPVMGPPTHCQQFTTEAGTAGFPGPQMLHVYPLGHPSPHAV